MPTPIIGCIGLNVAIKREDAHVKTAGGLHLPDGARAKQMPWVGTVVAVGSGHVLQKSGIRVGCECKVGDRVLVSRILCEDARLAGDEYIFTTEDKVLAILAPDTRVEDLR